MPAHGSANAAGQLVPVAGYLAAVTFDVAAQFETVAVAGAAQGLLQNRAAVAGGVGGAAADALLGAVAQFDMAGARPLSVQPRKRPALGRGR